jgi:hypothetical protein
MKRITGAALLLCLLSVANGQNSAPLLNVDWVDGSAAVAPERWAKASGASTIWWRVMASGMAFSEGGLSLSPAGLYKCSRQADPRLYRCDKGAGESGRGDSYAITLMPMAAVPKSPPGLPDGWIQAE